MIEIIINDINELPEAATRFVASMDPHGIYAFRGEMGAGKTTFIAEICRRLGALDEVSSPTFSIVNEYETEDGTLIYHFDCYRLESEADAMEIGADDYFTSGNLCLIEWPDNIGAALPEEARDVRIEVLPDGKRRIWSE